MSRGSSRCLIIADAPRTPLRSSAVLRIAASTDGKNVGCRRRCRVQLTPLYCLVRRLPQSQGAAATFIARERLVVGGLAWPSAHNYISPGPSGMLPGTTKNGTPWLVKRCISFSRQSLDRRFITFCRPCIAPIGSHFGTGLAALERCVTLCLSFLLSGLSNGCAGGINAQRTIIAFSPGVRAL